MKRLELVTKLELVGRALADSDLVQVFKCFCFTGSTIVAYNDALAIVAPCEVDKPFAVNGKILLGLLKNSHSEEVEFGLEKEELTIKAGKSVFKMPYMMEDQFLFKEPEDKWVCERPLGGEFLDGLEYCLMTASKDLAQPALMGVCLKSGQALYSCDGDALTAYLLNGESTAQLPEFMMPNLFCDAVLKVMSETEATDESKIQLSPEWVMAQLDTGYIIYGRLIQNDNPLDHEALIEKTLKTEPDYISIPEGLDSALSRARVVADSESAKTSLTVEKGKLQILTDTHTGVVRDVLLFKHADIQANVSAELMQRSIKICDEMSISENCTSYRLGQQLFVLLSNRS